MFQYAYARALAERDGLELRTTAWVGQSIFQGIDESAPVAGEGIYFEPNYRQTQADLIYTRRDCRRWFKWRPEVEQDLKKRIGFPQCVAHLRRGDYRSAGYVLVSRASYERHCDDLAWVTDDSGNDPIVDFYTMTRADRLYRANSTFSWWAGTLSNARVFSPIIEDLEVGFEQDCEFVDGNWARFCCLPNVTNLFLRE